MSQFTTNVVRNSAAGIFAHIAIKILSFGFSVFFIRRLGAEDYGQYAAVLAFGAIFVFLGDLGLSTYTVRQVARWREREDGEKYIRQLFGDTLVLRLLLSFLAAILIISTAWLTRRPPTMVLAIALGTLGLMMYAIQGACASVLGGYERQYLVSRATILNQLAFISLGALALLSGMGYFGLIVANLLAIALLTGIAWRDVRVLGIRPARIKIEEWKPLLRASLPFGVIAFTLGLSYKFDTILLNIFRSDVETGYYNAVYNLVFSAVVLSNAINVALYPSLARKAAVEPETLPLVYQRALRYLSILALPIAGGGWALADEIVPLLYGGAYEPAVPAFRILVWAIPLMFASEFLGYTVLVADQERRVARAIFISTALNITANLYLVPRFGFQGAATMTVVTEAVLASQYVWLLRHQLKQLNAQRVFAGPLVVTLGMVAIVLVLRPFLPLLALIATGAFVYLATLLVFNVVGREELRLIRSLRVSSESTAL